MSTNIMNKYDEKYTNILEDGEVSEEMLNIGLGLFGLTPNDDIGEFQAIVSNGLSTVFTHHKGVPHACQCFVHKETYTRIMILLSCVKPVELSIKNDDSTVLRYDLYEYMPKIIDHRNEYNMIMWELITPLNSYTNSEKCAIIMNNIVKLLWDIGKAIVGLHENGIYHGDSRIDNIGIKNGNFVLFDFDGSRSCSPSDKHIYKDFSDFVKSIEFNVNYHCEKNSKSYDKIKEYIPFPDNYFIESIIEKNDSIEFLDSLQIVV